MKLECSQSRKEGEQKLRVIEQQVEARMRDKYDVKISQLSAALANLTSENQIKTGNLEKLQQVYAENEASKNQIISLLEA